MKEFLSTFHSGNQKLFGNLHLSYQNASCVITLHDLESSKDSGKWPTIAAGLTDTHACDLISGLWGEPEKKRGRV